MELQPTLGETSPSAISPDILRRLDAITQAATVDPAKVQSLLEEAGGVQIADEPALQAVLSSLGALCGRLFAEGHTELGYSILQASADIALSATGRGLPPRCAIILSDKLRSLGQTEASYHLLEQTRSAVEESGSDDRPFYLAHVDNSFGNQLRTDGDLELAEQKLLLALQEFKSKPDGPTALHASILSNIGLVLTEKKLFDEAAAYLTRALEIDANSGAEPRTNAIILDNLAYVELEIAREAGPLDLGGGYINQFVDEHLRRADEYLKHASSAFQKALPDAEADYAICLGNRVELARCRNDFPSADRYSREALEILERVGNMEAVWAARATRAAVLYDEGKWQAIEDLLLPFNGGPVDPSVAIALSYLASAAARVGNTSFGLEVSHIVAGIDDQLLVRRLESIAEANATRVFAPFARRVEVLLGLGLAARAEGAEADWLYGVTLNRKGLLADRFGSAWINACFAQGAPVDLVRRVRSLRVQAARLDLDGTGATSIRAARERHDKAALQAQLAEIDLLRAIGHDAQLLYRITPDDVRSALDDDSLLMDLAIVRTIEDAQHYAVFLVRSSGPAELCELGPVDEINDLITSLEEAFRGRSADRDISWGDASEDSAADNSWANAAEKLAAIVFPPGLELPRNLRVSPIGLWSQLPFSLLAAGDGPIVENHCISFVPSGRWLGERDPSQHTEIPAAAPVVIGDPDYDLGTPLEQPFSLETRFRRLDYAAIEVRDVAERLHVEAKTGKEASRHELAAVRSPLVLHLATHGKMLDAFNSIAEQSEPRVSVMRSVGGVIVSEDVEPSEDFLGFTSAEFGDNSPQGRHRMRVRWLMEVGPRDPSSRSLIALAGANAWLAGVDTPEEIGTGLMTAAEFALLDLASTQLVVLSACETGSGAVSIGDGTLVGLRSAALLAGAESCVSGLWTVDDAATTDLMLAFYAALERGAARDEALREAQLTVRAQRPDPYYWAAWVLDGGKGPLDVLPSTQEQKEPAHAVQEP